MNKYFINENWCIRFESSNHFTCREGSIEITDLYIFKYPCDIKLNKKRTGWLPAFVTESKFYKTCTVNEDYIFEFETDEEAILMYEGMKL